MGKIQNSNEQTTLKNILFVDFFNALRLSQPELINVTEDELEDLANEYFKRTETKSPNTDKQLRGIGVDIAILESCYNILIVSGYDKNFVSMLESYKIELFPDNVLEVCRIIVNQLEVLNFKYTTLKAQEVQPPSSNMTGEDALAQLSVGLEMKLDFNQVTVLEYISFAKALKEKNQALKKATKRK